jgi:hypothetical protein
MANRAFNRKQALDKEIKEIYVQVAIGASGAPTLSPSNSVGVASVVRNSIGRYTVQLQDNYIALRQITQSRELASGAPGAVGGMVVRTNSVSTTGAITLEFVDTAGAAVELVSGSILRLKLDLKNSSAK